MPRSAWGRKGGGGGNLACLEQTVSRNMNVNSLSSEGSEEHGGEYLYYLREYVNHHKQTVGRNMNVKGAAGVEGSEENEEHAVENRGEGIFLI